MFSAAERAEAELPGGAKDKDEAMTNDSVFRHPQTPEEDLRDFLERLYRDIGISAVAAALEAISKRDGNDESAVPTCGLPMQRGKDLAA